MKKLAVILLLLTLLALTNSHTISYASFSDETSDDSLEIKTTDEDNNRIEKDEDENEDENEIEDEDDDSNRVIAKNPSQTTVSANTKLTLGTQAQGSSTLPKSKTITTSPKAQNSQTIATSEESTETNTTEPSSVNAANEEDKFDFMKELLTLLTSLKKIIFNTIS